MVRLLISALALASTVSFAHAQQIGRAVQVVNSVILQDGGSRIALRAQSPLTFGSSIVTGADSLSVNVLNDQTRLTVAANSRLRLDRLVFNPDGNTGSATLNLVEGAFRFTTGQLPASSFDVTTPTATLGIRGTRFVLQQNGEQVSVIVEEGEVEFSSNGGGSVIVGAGLASSIDGPGNDPSPPSPPSPSQQVVVASIGLAAATSSNPTVGLSDVADDLAERRDEANSLAGRTGPGVGDFQNDREGTPDADADDGNDYGYDE